jgi:uncharacterized membrane protein
MLKLRLPLKWPLVVLLVAVGVNHFVMTDLYVRMMPTYLPWHRELVLISGVCEVVVGVSLLVPRLVRAAAWGAIALFVAMFPANVHMALHPELFPNIPEWALWARLPLQGVLIAWAYGFTGRRGGGRAVETQTDAG